MNGRGLRLYGLSSFTRPVSYPCHRRSRPLRGGVTRGETGWEESAVVSFTLYRIPHDPRRSLPWAFATPFTRPFRRPRREPGPGRVTRSLRSLRSTSLHSSTRPTRGRSFVTLRSRSPLTVTALHPTTPRLVPHLPSPVPARVNGGRVVRRGDRGALAASLTRVFGRPRPEPTHERRGVSRLLSSASFHLPLVSLTSFPRLVIPSLLSVFPRLAHSVPSVILTPFGLRSYRSAPRGFASRFLHSLPPAFVSGRNRPGGRSLPHASLAYGAPRGT